MILGTEGAPLQAHRAAGGGSGRRSGAGAHHRSRPCRVLQPLHSRVMTVAAAAEDPPAGEVRREIRDLRRRQALRWGAHGRGDRPASLHLLGRLLSLCRGGIPRDPGARGAAAGRQPPGSGGEAQPGPLRDGDLGDRGDAGAGRVDRVANRAAQPQAAAGALALLARRGRARAGRRRRGLWLRVPGQRRNPAFRLRSPYDAPGPVPHRAGGGSRRAIPSAWCGASWWTRRRASSPCCPAWCPSARASPWATGQSTRCPGAGACSRIPPVSSAFATTSRETALRRIHWRATARSGRLQVKLYEPAVLQGVLLARRDGGRPRGRSRAIPTLELAVTAAASIADLVLGAGQFGRLLSNGGDAAERYPSDWTGGSFRRLEDALEDLGSRRRISAFRPVELAPGRGRRQWEQVGSALARLGPRSRPLSARAPRLRAAPAAALPGRPRHHAAPGRRRSEPCSPGLRRSGFEAGVVWIQKPGQEADAADLPPGVPIYPVRDDSDLENLGVSAL